MAGVRRKEPEHVPSKRSLMGSVGPELTAVELDKVTRTEPADNKKRRTLLITRQDGSWGFTIQSYGIHHKATEEVQLLTYVDYVDIGGPSYTAGLRPGDVVLSINGISMEHADHRDLIEYIRNCGSTMRMVVLFEDCCRKVELHLRYLKLQRILTEKSFELKALEARERMILQGRWRDQSCLSLVYPSASCHSLCEDQLSLRPELDLFPTPRAASPLDQGVMSPCAVPLDISDSEYVLSSTPYDCCTQSLPRPQRRHLCSSNGNLSASFDRKERPASMNLKRSLGNIREFDVSDCDTVKFPRRPDSLELPTLSASVSTTTLERYCVDARTQSLSSHSPESATCSTFLSSPETASGLTESFSTDSKSLTPFTSQNLVTSGKSPRFRPRASFRSRSFRHRTFSPLDSHLPTIGIVLTEENSREAGEPILVGVKPIARAFSFRMPWERQPNLPTHKPESKAHLPTTPCSTSSGVSDCDSSSDFSVSSPPLKSPSPLKSYKSREMLAASSPQWQEMDSLAYQLGGVSMSRDIVQEPAPSSGSISSFESSATSGSYALTDPFSCDSSVAGASSCLSAPGSIDSMSECSSSSSMSIKRLQPALNHYLMGPINEKDEVTAL